MLWQSAYSDQTKRAVLGAIRKYRLDDVAAHSPFVSFRRLMELALGAHVFLAPSVTAADGDAEGTPFMLQHMMATGVPAIGVTAPRLPSATWAPRSSSTGSGQSAAFTLVSTALRVGSFWPGGPG